MGHRVIVRAAREKEEGKEAGKEGKGGGAQEKGGGGAQIWRRGSVTMSECRSCNCSRHPGAESGGGGRGGGQKVGPTQGPMRDGGQRKAFENTPSRYLTSLGNNKRHSLKPNPKP